MRTSYLSKDFLAGALLFAIGIGILWGATGYSIGTARRMGPGFFPAVLGVILIGLSAIILLRGLRAGAERVGGVHLRPAICVLGSMLIFALTVFPLGLPVAIVAAVLCASFASADLDLRSALILGLILAAGSSLVFVGLLGQHLPLRGPWLGG